MAGALSVDTPSKLLAKLRKELRTLQADPDDAYAALNAARDAYHLREWIWHGWLEGNAANQAAVGSGVRDEQSWIDWVNASCGHFSTIRELCNGSKHFVSHSSPAITAVAQGGWGTQPWDVLPWGAEGYYVEVGGTYHSVTDMLEGVETFWRNLISAHAIR